MDTQHLARQRYCERCENDRMVRLVRDISQSGVSLIYWYCTFGEHSITKQSQYIKHERVKAVGYDPDRLPVIHNYSGREICAVCGSPFTEEHHWAPKHLFGEDVANKWPTSYLCNKCHKLWHMKVTPEMSNNGHV